MVGLLLCSMSLEFHCYSLFHIVIVMDCQLPEHKRHPVDQGPRLGAIATTHVWVSEKIFSFYRYQCVFMGVHSDWPWSPSVS